MRYVALATDYDGTLATEGQVDDATIAALTRLRESGRRLVLVTGRDLDDLLRVFPRIDLFDRVVAENGALLYRPATREELPLAERPPDAFAALLRERGVDNLAVGRVIVATWEPHETAVLECIRDLGLELQVIFNKGAVMVLPSGVNKASGLAVALAELGLSPHNAVGVGDAENDHALLAVCERGVAVANALPMLKERADMVVDLPRGAGVAALIERMIADDLLEVPPHADRQQIVLGETAQGQPVRLAPLGHSVLIAGTSGSGKSTLATAMLEKLAAQGYQYCIIDPEGDYESFAGAVVLGDSQRAPGVDEVMDLLQRPDQSVVVNLLGIKLEDRPAFFESLMPRLQELRARTGRPHWVVVDEAHHLLPATWDPAGITLPQRLDGVLMITVHPDHLPSIALAMVDTMVAFGERPDQAIAHFRGALGQGAAASPPVTLEPGEALIWSRGAGGDPQRFHVQPPEAERQRHRRKYAEGELGADRSFYFRGPEGKLNLRAQNLSLFMQLAEGVDDATWQHHLRQGDYSRWFRDMIKDPELAEQAQAVESSADAPAAESRAAIRELIDAKYTLPA
ncbi:HAD-IIB family hydrolase [Chloroflexia bacterium SDU3-3]|nr:HAD-IIB family hydrolase [Chloroflexia bacterium SDU3-3]